MMIVTVMMIHHVVGTALLRMVGELMTQETGRTPENYGTSLYFPVVLSFQRKLLCDYQVLPV